MRGVERLEEFAPAYDTFKDAGVKIVIASPKGGQPPLDPKSNEPNFQTDLTHRFEADADANARLATTVRLDNAKAEDYDTVFYPGRHGPMWDLAKDQNSVKLLETMFRAGKPGALVYCARRAASRQSPPTVSRWFGQEADRPHKHRGRGGRPHQGGALPSSRTS
jgi:putative intracellular protease/amidase